MEKEILRPERKKIKGRQRKGKERKGEMTAEENEKRGEMIFMKRK